MAKTKRVQKTVYFDAEVWEALEKQMKVSHNPNVSVTEAIDTGLPKYHATRQFHTFSLYLCISGTF